MAERTLPLRALYEPGRAKQARHLLERRRREKSSSITPILRAAREGKLGGKVVA